MWLLSNLIEHCNSCKTEKDGKWYPAKPISYFGLKPRLKDAYTVLTGKADAFKWDYPS